MLHPVADLSFKCTKPHVLTCKEAKLQARIKPTALCSAIDKENSIEFLLISLLLIYFTTVAMCLLSHGPHVTLVM